MRNKLYVYETHTMVIIEWEGKGIIPAKVKMQDSLYYHPNVQIFVGKMPGVKKRNHRALDNAIMLALQDVKIPVRLLRKPKPVRRKKKRQANKYINIIIPGFEE